VPSADPARRSQLLGLKLAALVRDHVGTDHPVTPGIWPGGAALLRNGEAWILAEDEPARSLGRALAWARQQGAEHLHLLAESSTGLLARRASQFAQPASVWHVDGRSLIEAVAEPFAPEPVVDPGLVHFAELIEAGGATVVVEHGVLVGEVEGLEVCRALRDPHTDECRLEVGVGAHDREAFLLIHGAIPAADALRMVVDAVVPHRQPGAEPHPLNRLGAERAVRARIVRDPSIVGAASLAPASPPVPRENLKDAVPCAALGLDPDGRPVVVVCSTGIDLDVVPWAADARAYLAGQAVAEARLVIVVPRRDAVSVTQALAANLRRPAQVVSLEPATRG